ncbi:4176_t:CDS:2 [Gigaspora margarita]|uniref:4176_t:CDS:1 n=1 Tax=Gigaspora margarita TaxID=4874 RepID=A0ABN7URS9_GIGMA|nr:4176_t:CDS:2 [Gigaspora margarita]
MISLCNKCNRKFIGYPETFCRRNFVSGSKKQCENQVIHDFLREIQSNSLFCNDFINWIPNSDVNYIKSHKKTGFSEIFLGTWKPVSSLNIVLKVFRDSRNISDNEHRSLNEVKIHHQFLGKCAIPFYGLTLYPETLDYAMIMKRAIHGDLCNYIHTHKYVLSWTERVKILLDIARALDHIHSLNLVHHDFHCKNILVDEDYKIFICDFGLSCNTNSHDTPVADSSTSIDSDNQTRQFDIDLKLDSDSDKQENDDFLSLPTRSFFIESLMFSTLSSLYDGASSLNGQVPSLLDINKLFAATDEIFNPNAQN